MSDTDLALVDSTDQTLIEGVDNNSNLLKTSEKFGDFSGAGLESNTDFRVTDTYQEIGKNKGKEYGASMDETLVSDDNNLSQNLENIAANGGVVLGSNTDVRVADANLENGGNEGKEYEGSMNETLILDENNLSGKIENIAGDGVVVPESNYVIRDTDNEEKEIHFDVSDLVWGKVRSHPWWPGQIFNPSDASEKAQKYSKKDGFLIAYFGDQTFAWNESSKIKPFQENFISMEKQSKTESFCHAVDCVLGEVSRRVELGLACKCLSNEVCNKIKTQSVINAGIRKESSEREGGDGYYSGENFMPLDLVRFVEGLGKASFGGIDRLEFVIAKAQLLAFNRQKGFSELPEFQMFGEFLGNSFDGDVPLGKEMGIKGSKKRKKISGDYVSPIKKERKVSERLASSLKKCNADTYVTDNMMVEEKNDLSSPVTGKNYSNVGKRIVSAYSVLKDGGNGSVLSSGKKRGRKKAITAENAYPEEILSHLCAAARSPVKECSSLRPSINFLSDMRNMFLIKKSESEKSSDKSLTMESGEELPKVGNMGDTEKIEGFEDSYWTDRVVVGDIQEQVLFEPDTPNKNAINPDTPYGNGITSAGSDLKIETGDDVNDEECNPTALILNFMDIESVPSQLNLNNIFRRYGPLNETGTEVLKKSKRAKVIFKRREDAETAFSSSGKFSIFGPSLVSYRLHYLPIKQNQDTPAKKRSKKGGN